MCIEPLKRNRGNVKLEALRDEYCIIFLLAPQYKEDTKYHRIMVYIFLNNFTKNECVHKISHQKLL